MFSLAALVVATLAGTLQAPRNVRLSVLQEADTLSGEVRWAEPQDNGGTPIESYQWQLWDDTLVIEDHGVSADARSAAFAVPFAWLHCEAGMALHRKQRPPVRIRTRQQEDRHYESTAPR